MTLFVYVFVYVVVCEWVVVRVCVFMFFVVV